MNYGIHTHSNKGVDSGGSTPLLWTSLLKGQALFGYKFLDELITALAAATSYLTRYQWRTSENNY